MTARPPIRNSAGWSVVAVLGVVIATLSAGTPAQPGSGVHSAVTASTGEASARVGTRSSPRATPPAYQPVATSVMEELTKNESADVVLTVDESVQSSPEFAALRSSLRSTGGDSFAGTLSREQVEVLAGLGGVRVDRNVTFSVDPPLTNAAPTDPSGAPSADESRSTGPASDRRGLVDSDVSIPETDSRLVQTVNDLGIDGTGVTVAVVDTGVDTNAVGLAGKVVHREDLSTPTSSCADGGYLDPYGHGTHVASIIAGAPGSNYSRYKNGRDIRGVAKGAQIVDVRIFNCAGQADSSQIESALNWILSNKDTYGIRVVNMSLGTTGVIQDGLDSTSILVNRVVAAGVVVVVAAGNNGDNPQTITSPGTAEYATTVGAASVSKYGAYTAPYSSIGPTSDGRIGIDLIAPGSSIDAARSTKLGSRSIIYSGTSMASPYVAGVAALLVDQRPLEAPSGTQCVLGAGCPAGVVASSMANPVQARMKTTDWYGAGPDKYSGAGLVSASATLLGENAPPGNSFSGTFSKDSPNTVLVPPHADDIVISLELPSSYRTDGFDNQFFNVSVVDPSYKPTQLEVPCTRLSDSMCMSGAFSFTPHVFAYLLRPSNTAQQFVVSVSKNVDFEANVTGTSSTLSLSNGVQVGQADLTAASSASLTVTRTSSAAAATTYSVTTSGPLSTSATVVLPAGPAGTTATLTVTKSGSIGDSEEKVLLTGPDGTVLAGRVIMRTTGTGRISYPNVSGFSDSNNGDRLQIVDGGAVFMMSRATGMKSSNGYDQPGFVPAGSLTLSKVPFTQSSVSQIDMTSAAEDGSAFVGTQWPAGAGIVPGDTDTRWNFFVHDMTTGTNTEVGPNNKLWSSWSEERVAIRMRDDGDSVVWATQYPSGSDPVKLAVQGGANFSTTTVIDSFPATTTLVLWGYKGTHIIVQVEDSSRSIFEFRDYSPSGLYTTIDLDGLRPTDSSVNVSRNGTAVSVMNGNDEKFVCNYSGQKIIYDSSFRLTVGMSSGGPIAIADDCSWVVTVWTAGKNYPRGIDGHRLIKMFPDGTFYEIDRAAPTGPVAWGTNSSGTSFIRATIAALEAGDVNGELDYYRDLGAGDPTLFGGPASISYSTAVSTLKMGGSTALTFSSNASGSVSASTSSNCSFSFGMVTALRGFGTCTVTLQTPADSIRRLTTRAVTFTLEKSERPSSQLTTSSSGSGVFGETLSFSVSNSTGQTVSRSVSGPCELVSSTQVKLTSGTGTCRVTASVPETTDYVAHSTYVDIVAGKATRPAGQVVVTTPGTGAYATTVAYGVVNDTGVTARHIATGSCEVAGDRTVRMTSGSGTCRITTIVDSTADHEQLVVVSTFAATKARWTTNQLSVRVQTPVVYVGDTGAYSVTNFTGAAVVTTVTGPCVLSDSGLVRASSTGTCLLTVTSPETSDYESFATSAAIDVRVPVSNPAASNGQSTGGGSVTVPTAKPAITLKATRARSTVSLTVTVNSPLFGKKITIQRYSNGSWVTVQSGRVGAGPWTVAVNRSAVTKYRAVYESTRSSTVTK